MAVCAMLTHNKVTQQAWQGIQQAVSQYGVVVARDSGSGTKDGLAVSWSYDTHSETLSIQRTEHPLLVNCSMINSHMQ